MRLISFLVILTLVSCKKDKPDPVIVAPLLSNGMAVLCEGLFQQNNSSVSWINFANNSISNSLFQDRANRQLGDTGNDLQRYGGKIYIVVNASSTIEVMDATKFTPIKQISMIINGIAKQPRSIAFFGSNAYVTCYDGYVDVIDTTTLIVTQRIQVGTNPEGLAIANNKLYVANSGGLNSPNMDTTLSVIDLLSNTELQKITIGINPGQVITDSQGDVYVIIRGNYGSIPSSIVRIDSQTDAVVQQLAINASSISKMNNNFLIANYDFTTSVSNVALFNPLSESIENPSFVDVSNVTTLYGVHYRTFTDQIYLMDAMSFTNTGYVREYTSTGTFIQNFHVGLNPSKIIFYD